MKTLVKSRRLLIIVLWPLFGLLSCATFSKDGHETITNKEIKNLLSQKHKISVSQLEILNRKKATFRWIDKEVEAVKLIDRQSNKGYELYIEKNKNLRTKQDLFIANQKAYFERYGKLEVELFEKLEKAKKQELFKVGVWLKSKPRLVKSSDRHRRKGKLTEFRKLRKKSMDAAQLDNNRLIKRFNASMDEKGVKAAYSSKIAPLVMIEANTEKLKSIAEIEDVEFMYLARVGRDANNTAIPSVAGSAWPSSQYEGDGVRVAIVEDDGIDFSNPYLSAADGGSYQTDTTNLGHPTQTAGVAGSRHPIYRGMAPKSTLISGDGLTYDAQDIIDATDWAIATANADVINCSFGFDTGDTRHDLMARYYDHVVWNEWRIVTPAAGNSAGAVLSPGVAYNVLTVGGINDADTPWHVDDTIYSSTSWQDPPSVHNDREKPEVSAVATGILTTEPSTYFTNNNQWITLPGGGHSGTSYAAPATAGALARLIDRKSFLYTWPEELKAIMMASSVRKVSDASVDTDNRSVDVQEGVGTIVVPFAEKVVSQNWHQGAYLTSSSFPYNRYFDVEKGDIVRFVITWDAHTDSNYTTVGLEADLDLHVYDPDGIRVAYSVSWDNPYEVVEFTANKTGKYKAWIRDWRFDASYEWLGLAWSRR